MSIAWDLQDIWYRHGAVCAVMDEPMRSTMQCVRALCTSAWECEDGKGGCVKFFEFCDLSILKVEQNAGNVVTQVLGYDCTSLKDESTEGD